MSVLVLVGCELGKLPRFGEELIVWPALGDVLLYSLHCLFIRKERKGIPIADHLDHCLAIPMNKPCQIKRVFLGVDLRRFLPIPFTVSP